MHGTYHRLGGTHHPLYKGECNKKASCFSSFLLKEALFEIKLLDPPADCLGFAALIACVLTVPVNGCHAMCSIETRGVPWVGVGSLAQGIYTARSRL